jgi:endonuclease/exonuclease/phosphatase family metal-dependent hydrolase
MTFNIQSGFGADDAWDLERTARAIEAQKPDIVMLQEVSRGWPITSNVDQATWLSNRLEMPVYFGSSSVDGLWGNAILTRAPVSSISVRRFDSTENLQRSVVMVRVDTASGPIDVFATHLDDPSDAVEVRADQTDQLVQFMDGSKPAILGADLNSKPNSDVLHMLENAGLRSAGPETGVTSPNGEDRIDYIMITDDIVVRDARIPETNASDHLPVVSDLNLNST